MDTTDARAKIAAMELDATLSRMADEVERVNRANGWYEEDRTIGDDVALLHSEASEMLEAYREHGLADMTAPPFPGEPDRLPKPEGFGSEAADVLIRLLDTCKRRGVDLGFEYRRKIAHNAQRGYRHGGKRL